MLDKMKVLLSYCFKLTLKKERHLTLINNFVRLNFLILVHNTDKRYNRERFDESIGTSVGTPPIPTTIWL